MTIATLIGNMTASGPSLRALVVDLTGCDPLAGDDMLGAFAWRNDLPCSDCAVIDSTAVVSIDGEHDDRLCFHCLADRLA